MKNKYKLLMYGILGTVITAGASSYITTNLLVKTALDRKQPKLAKITGRKISGGSLNRYEETCKSSADSLKQQEHEVIEINGIGNVPLVGHYFPCKNAKRFIIAFHGWRSSWNYDYGLISDFWQSNACSVLYAEQRGQNESGGDYIGFGLTERYDCIEWCMRASELCNNTIPIYLAGLSMGATTVLMAADLPLGKAVHGIMADCGFTSPEAIWEHVIKNNLHLPYRLYGKLANAICMHKIKMHPGDHSTIDALSKTNIPVLFIHGTEDKFVPVEMTYENFKNCSSEKRLFIVPGAEHAMSYCVDKEGYEKAVLTFWEDFDNYDRFSF